MRKLYIIIFLFPLLAEAQLAQNKYFLNFTDKDNSPFTLNDPSAYLSTKAIERRNTQNIPIVESDLPVNPDYVSQVAQTGATVLTKSKWFNGITIQCDTAVLNSVLNLPFIVKATRVYIKSNGGTTKDHYEIPQWKKNSPVRVMSYDYGASYNQIHLMNGEFLHESGYSGEGMIIALLDAGFYSADIYPAFDHVRGLNNILATWDFVEGNSSVYEDDTHGMMVLSSIAGYVPGELVGTAPDAAFLLLRTEDAATESIIEEYNWDAAAEYADSAGADVISSSLGYTEFDDPSMNHVYADMDGDHCPSSIAADIAVSKGILVCVSAGNSGNDDWHYISAPSDGDSVISVAAVTPSGNHVGFSSWGPAPDGGTVKPNVAAQGLFCTLTDPGGGVGNGSGTSFSCPILAGAATCLWQEFRSLTSYQIKTAIEQSANYATAPNDSLGYGIPNFQMASYLLTTGSIPTHDNVIGVYPNPFSENLNVSFFSTKSQNVRIEVVNTVGQIVSEQTESATGQTVNTFTILNNNNLTSGFYLVKVSTGEETIVNRVLKN